MPPRHPRRVHSDPRRATFTAASVTLTSYFRLCGLLLVEFDVTYTATAYISAGAHNTIFTESIFFFLLQIVSLNVHEK